MILSKLFLWSNFEKLFNYTKSEKERLIDACFSINTSFNTLHDFKKNAEFLEDKGDVDEQDANFYTSSDEGIKLISNAIFTHIPIGPYEGFYYFVKRDTNL